MRYQLKLLVILVFFLGCKEKKEKVSASEKQIQVEFNPNIHTSHIMELFVWPGNYPTRPIIIEAQEYFEPYKEHPAIKFSDSLLKNDIIYFDELSEILLYLDDLPSTSFKYSLENSPYSDRIDIIQVWVKKLSNFFVEAKVDSFLTKHKEFYVGAKQEVLKNLPPKNFAKLIEEYYREKKLGYIIIPAPEMPTGGAYGQRGIGPYVFTNDGTLVYQIISASLPVGKDSITNQNEKFGFDNKEFILRNSFHEFGHAFVNPILAKEKNQKLIEKSKYLFTPELQRVMLKQNYDNWSDCIAEHLVRLGEIRLAERSGDKIWAKELRQLHTNQLDFIFLPEFEEQIIKYEGDISYESFEAYLPELLKVLDDFNSATINDRITAHNNASCEKP